MENSKNVEKKTRTQIHPACRGLVRETHEPMNWTGNFNYPGMVRLRTIGDGSCFFHAIVNSFYIPYRKGNIDGKPFNRIKFVQNFRKDLANKLNQNIDSRDQGSPTHYDILSRGELRKLSKALPQYSLESMQKELISGTPVDNIYNEFISNIIDKDIYLLDLSKRDVYVTGGDEDILFKHRNSIVILYMPGHYELVGLLSPEGNIITHFDPDHTFIKYILQKYRQKTSPQ